MAKRQSAGKRRKAAETNEPLCAHGEPTGSNGKSPGYEGPGHCAGCDDHGRALAQDFEASLAAGEVNEQGYAFSEWMKAGKDPAAWADAPALQPPAADPELTEVPPVHVVRCTDCPAGVRYQALPSRSGFTVLERYGVDPDQTFGIGTRGQPICPFGHGEMTLADEQLPAAEAITQVAEQVNGTAAPTQAQLFDMAQPFNFEGAWMDIELKNGVVAELARVNEDDAARAKRSRKALEEAQTLLSRMIETYHERRVTKAREAQARAERAARAEPTVPAVTAVDEPPRDEDLGSDDQHAGAVDDHEEARR